MEIVPVVKYWMPHIKVIGPESIVETIERDIEMYRK
jgi:hypothetical protein